jgi:hypothetical protein
MNLRDLVNEMEALVKMPQYSQLFKTWINHAVLEISSEINLPDLRLSEPVEVTTHDDVWLYDLPKAHLAWKTGKAYVLGNVVEYGGYTYTCISAHTSGSSTIPGSGVTWEDVWEVYYSPNYYYQKEMFKVRDSSLSAVTIMPRFEQIEETDPEHYETGDNVTQIGIKGEKFATYPMADDVLYMWFMRKPTAMVNNYDKPDGIPEERHLCIIPRVVVRNYEMIQKMAITAPIASLKWWLDKDRAEFRKLATFLILRDQKPRRHGGRDPLP